MKFIVGPADEIPPGERKIVRVAGRSIGVFNVGGEFYAVRNRCPHQGAPLCEGKLWGVLKSDVPGSFEYDATKEILTCIWHGWEFSLKTGQSWCDPQRLRVRSYQLSVETPDQVPPGTPIAADDRVKNPLISTVKSGTIPPPADPSKVTPDDVAAAAAAEDTPADSEAPAPGMVKGPYQVETYPVEVEGGMLYLVMDVTDVADTRARAAATE